MTILRTLAATVLAAGLAAQDAVAPKIVTARLIDVAGRPLADVGAVYGPQHRVTTTDALRQPIVRSGADGHLRCALPPLVRADDPILLLAGKGRMALEVRFHQPPDELDLGTITLFDAVTLSGRVRDAEGQPLAGVRVETSVRVSSLQQKLRNGHLWQRWAASAVTDAQGIYAVPGIAAGVVEMVLSKPGYYAAVHYPVRTDTPLQPTLTASGFVAGKLLGPRDGVTIYALTEFGRVLRSLGEIDTDGAFRVPISGRGRLKVIAQTLDYRQIASRLLHGSADDVVIDLHPPPSRIVQLTVAADGQPVPSFRVLTSWQEPYHTLRSAPQYPLPAGGVRSVNGALALPIPANVTDGSIVVVADGCAAVKFVDSELRTPELRVALQPESSIDGHVVERGSNQPVAGARVWATLSEHGVMSWGRQTFALTDDDGHYRIGGLFPGEYTVQVEHPTFEPEACERRVAGNIGFDNIALQPLVALAGRIDGRVPAGAAIGLQPRDTLSRFNALDGIRRISGRDPAPAAVATDGTFRLEGLERGQHAVALRLPPLDYASSPRWLPLGRLAAGRDLQRIDLQQVTTARLAGQVRIDGAEAASLDLQVALYRDVPDVVLPVGIARTDRDGMFVIEAPPGSYRLKIIDLVIGLDVAQPAETIRLAAGETTRIDPLVGLQIVTLELDGAADFVLVNSDTEAFGTALAFGLHQGVRLRPDERRLQLALPAGKFVLQATSQAGYLKPVNGSYRTTILGKIRLSVPLPPPASVTWKLDAPPSDAALR